MTNDEIQLVLKDLSARLPYGVYIKGTFAEYDYDTETLKDDVQEHQLDVSDIEWLSLGACDDIKPYLRPLEDMTESERSLYNDLRNALTYQENGEYDLDDFNELNDFLNRNHLDHRGLIEKGLAIRVTKENNPYKD